MKPEYKYFNEIGSTIVEVINPINGEIQYISTVVNYDVDNQGNLHIVGIDCTEFFSKNKYAGSNFQVFADNVLSHLQNSKTHSIKFSKHFPFSVFSNQ